MFGCEPSLLLGSAPPDEAFEQRRLGRRRWALATLFTQLEYARHDILSTVNHFFWLLGWCLDHGWLREGEGEVDAFFFYLDARLNER